MYMWPKIKYLILNIFLHQRTKLSQTIKNIKYSIQIKSSLYNCKWIYISNAGGRQLASCLLGFGLALCCFSSRTGNVPLPQTDCGCPGII